MPLRIFKRLWLSMAIGAILFFVTAETQAGDKIIKIGVLNDMSGVYSDFLGLGSVISALMAVEDFGGSAAGAAIEVVAADHLNKADVALGIVQRWFDVDGIDVVVDVPNSAVALAVSNAVRQRNKVMLGSGAGTSELTGRQCSPNTVHWTYDTWAQGHGLARALVERGLKRWFFVTSDYAFGQDLERNASAEVTKNGGMVLGSVRHPLGTSDFSSYLLQARASGADVVAFANAGGDFTTSMKQAVEFGLPLQQKLTGLILDTNNVPAMGIKTAQGLFALNPFYWDMNDGTRAWAKRWSERHPKHNMPNDMQAGVYSAILHYLKAVDKVGGAADGRLVVETMKATPADDLLFGKGRVREDGRALHPMYLFQVKTPEESKGTWDVYKLVSTVPAELAFRPLAEGNCPMLVQ